MLALLQIRRLPWVRECHKLTKVTPYLISNVYPSSSSSICSSESAMPKAKAKPKDSNHNMKLSGQKHYSNSSSMLPPAFREEAKKWEALVDFKKLSANDIMIYERHKEAEKNCEESYEDPETGFMVMTRFAHYIRGYCCGDACRHCPFAHMNVLPNRKTKLFNTAFYK